MDFYKTLCEYGKEFSEKEFFTIFKYMKDHKLLNDEALRCFTLLLTSLNLS